MPIWLGALAAKYLVQSTEVARAATGHLTSVVLLDGEGPLDFLADLVRAFLGVINFAQSRGLSAIPDPLQFIREAIEAELGPVLNEWFLKLLTGPDVTARFLWTLYAAMAIFGLTFLLFYASSYLGWVGWKVSVEHYEPDDIMRGVAGIDSPQHYFLWRLTPALVVVLATPLVFLWTWHIMHHMIVLEALELVYPTSSLGEDLANLVVTALDGRTWLWMAANAPGIFVAMNFYLLVYLLLNLLTFFAWVWVIVQETRYGDGISGHNVMVDTGLWAIGVTSILGLLKVLTVLTPKATSFLSSFGVSLPMAFIGWVGFSTMLTLVLAVASIVAIWRAKAAVRTIMVRHVVPSPSYVPVHQMAISSGQSAIRTGQMVARGAKVVWTALRA
jgi:hypothetical protein